MDQGRTMDQGLTRYQVPGTNLFVDFLKQNVRLGSPVEMVLVFGLLAAWMWVRPSTRRAAQVLAGIVALYWFLATPIGAGLLVWTLAAGLTPIQSADEAKGADTVVVLGGGANTFRQDGVVLGALTGGSVMRALEAARVSKLIQARLIIASGGIPTAGFLLKPESELLREALISAGVPADRILQDPQARTTADHPRTLAPILASHHVRRLVLVTSPMHMRRALRIFRAAGLDPIPSPSLLRPDNRPPPSWVIPTEDALGTSDQVVYEYAAWIYYWFNGWT